MLSGAAETTTLAAIVVTTALDKGAENHQQSQHPTRTRPLFAHELVADPDGSGTTEEKM